MHRTSSRTSLSSRTLLNLRISRPLSRSLCAIPSRVKRETEQLQDVLLKINAKHLGPLERRPFTEGIPKPVVLLLGNHSSGKVRALLHACADARVRLTPLHAH